LINWKQNPGAPITHPPAEEARALSLVGKKPVVLTPLRAVLSEQEKDLFSLHKPYGFILFGKHCETPVQLQKLCSDLRACAGDDCIISIDQEGGRVARMRAPAWKNFPPAANMDDAYQTYFDLGKMLSDNGINTNFAPCLDVVADGDQCDAIGDRCFSPDPIICGKKGVQSCRGLLDKIVTPVIKHMPGHGRAVEDSHFFLPTVKASAKELDRDLLPFQHVAQSGLNVAGMTCHVIYQAWDAHHPATLSKTVIHDIIRGEIGFKGTLYSDDLAMKALGRYGDIVKRVELCLGAGCDVALPCHTTLDETKRILESL
jgi:beta-N-acetylhexosaminidase